MISRRTLLARILATFGVAVCPWKAFPEVLPRSLLITKLSRREYIDTSGRKTIEDTYLIRNFTRPLLLEWTSRSARAAMPGFVVTQTCTRLLAENMATFQRFQRETGF